MLNQFSWQEFLVAIIMLAALYYLVVIILYFRKEATDLLQGKKPKPILSSDAPSKQNIMGASKSYADSLPVDKLVYVSSADEVMVGGNTDEQQQYVPRPESEGVVLSVRELMQEVKVLAEALKQEATPKEECASLFRALLSKYSVLKDEGYADGLSVLIHRSMSENPATRFKLVEVEKWWPESN